MRQVFLIATITALGITAVGCDLFGDKTTSTGSSSQSPVASSSPASPSFSKPTVEQKSNPKGILPPDLISSTDPNQRVQQVKGNRSDPFALLPTTPTVQIPPDATTTTTTTTTTTSAGSTGSAGSAGSRTSGGTTAQTRGSSQSRNRASVPSRSPNRSSTTATRRSPNAKPAPRSPIAAATPRPQPTLANAVQVTGVVQVGDIAYAIINAPNEPTSRYVHEGQRLAGGQVLVKRIEMNRSEPVVVLEQYGVEVSRAVGEGGTPVSATGSPAAAIPNPNPAT